MGQALTNSQRFASFLHHQLGVQPEERVGVFMSNSCAMVATTFGIGYLRATAVMLNTELRSAFLRHQLNDSQLSTVVVDSALVEHIASFGKHIHALPESFRRATCCSSARTSGGSSPPAAIRPSMLACTALT